MKEYYKTPTTISAISAVMLIGLIFDGQLRIGYGINKIFPCETPDFNSFPCYGKYSIYLFLFVLVIFFLSLGYILELRKQQSDFAINPLKVIAKIFSLWIVGGIFVYLISLIYYWLGPLLIK